MEFFMAWYSGNKFELYELINRALGPYAWVFWCVLLCNVGSIQAIWSTRVRQSPLLLFVISLIVNLGMWLERFMIIVVSLHRDFVPSAWGMFYPTFWDWATLFGSIGLFVTLMFLFIRVLPMISMSELRELVPEPEPEASR